MDGLSNAKFQLNDTITISVTISAGMALRKPKMSFIEWAENAELSLQQAKQTGRNRVRGGRKDLVGAPSGRPPGGEDSCGSGALDSLDNPPGPFGPSVVCAPLILNLLLELLHAPLRFRSGQGGPAFR